MSVPAALGPGGTGPGRIGPSAALLCDRSHHLSAKRSLVVTKRGTEPGGFGGDYLKAILVQCPVVTTGGGGELHF